MASTNHGFVLPPPPPDPHRTLRIACVGIWGAIACFGIGFAALDAVGAAALVFVLSGAVACGLAWHFRRLRHMEVGSALVFAAVDRIQRGRLDEARYLLDAVAPNAHRSVVGQSVAILRARLALYSGDAEEALALATSGVREGQRLGLVGLQSRDAALSVRAVALAALGRAEEARLDAKRVKEARYPTGLTLSTVTLSEAIVLARAADFDTLETLLRKNRALLFGATTPQERRMARALARLCASRSTSVYRNAAKPDEPLDDHASWIATLVPEAAAFSRSPSLGGPLDAPKELDEATRKMAARTRARPRTVRNWRLTVVRVVTCAFLGLVMIGAGTAATRDFATATARVRVLGVGAVAILILLAALAIYIWRARQATVDLGNAHQLRLRGELDEARARFETLTQSHLGLARASAHSALAVIAFASSDLPTARRHVEDGVEAAHSSDAVFHAASPFVLPALLGQRAAFLALDHKQALAEAELETIRTAYPLYPGLAYDSFCVRLFAATAAKAFDEAAALARSRPEDFFLGVDEELLCDVLRVNAGDPLPEGERERIEQECRESPRSAAYLDLVAPSLRSIAFRGGARIGYGVAAPDLTTEIVNRGEDLFANETSHHAAKG